MFLASFFEMLRRAQETHPRGLKQISEALAKSIRLRVI
jgi:hypothetical protein